jgi:hypothetical protein
MALLMAGRRAVRCSGIEKEGFYLWAEVESRLEQQDAAAFSELTDALNHLVAADDTLDSLPNLMAKRRLIQAQRKRGDGAILELFRDPLRPIVEDRDYIKKEAELLRLLRLDQIFDVERYEQLANSYRTRPPLPASRLRGEMKALQWQGVHAIMHPPPPKSPSRATRFFQVWRECGLRTALRLSWEALRRGP